ncbi:MAG: single-stranded DNA-binding protein [Coriobacteriia bacterium]|nr:MAG: single-stranded DNA-binding protein [Coriobacteriia bacterium]
MSEEFEIEEELEAEEGIDIDVEDNVDEQITEEDEVRSEEDLDEVADTAIEVLRTILAHFDAEGAEINEYEGDEQEIILDVVGGDLAILIGRRGHTLDAIQTLVSNITNRKLGYRYPITIDIESYKHRQRQKIESLAYSAASRADRQDREVSLRPMNPYERRLVHMALRDDERVETYSVGEEPNRHVVVAPA